jgi:hypothetical protein
LQLWSTLTRTHILVLLSVFRSFQGLSTRPKLDFNHY